MIDAKNLPRIFLPETLMMLVVALATMMLFIDPPNASPQTVREAVLACPSLRIVLEAADAPLSKTKLKKALNNCLALELQRSGLPK